MNAILMKESDSEINAFLNNLSLHQSFEEDDSEDEEFYTLNPSGSVLQPASNPYNKQKKIVEANESLFAEEVAPKSPQKVKFNRVEKRICYDYFGSSFESDSIKSYEEEESEKESVIQITAKQTNEPMLDIKGTHLQPKIPANKVVVTVTPKKDDDHANSESESEDVCVGTIPKSKFSSSVVNEEYSCSSSEINDKTNNSIQQTESIKTNPKYLEENKTSIIETTVDSQSNIDKSQDQLFENTDNIKSTKDKVNIEDKKEEFIFLELEKPSQECSDHLNENFDFYPCLANHSGITIRITGADSIESVESESTEDEVQLEENYSSSLYNVVELKPENKILISKTYHNHRVKETTFKVSKDSFILKGTKSTQNIRSSKPNKRLETGSLENMYTKKENNKKENNTSKTRIEKTDQPEPDKVQKDSSKATSKPKPMSLKSKQLGDNMSKKTEECYTSTKKLRPKSCVEKESVKVKTSSRPLTAPVKRSCCQWGHPHLPEYNGLRSEYGLSAEQLMERKRHKMELLKKQKQKKEQKYKEEQEKRKENEAQFIAWLENKRKQAQMQYLRNEKRKAESGIKIYPAPTAHLKRTGALRGRKLFKSQRKCVSLEELLNNASSHEKKTYKIYLGLSFE